LRLLIMWCARSTRVVRHVALTACLLFAATAVAQPPVRNILLLQSFSRGNLTLDTFTSNFRVELERRTGSPMNVLQINVLSATPVGAREEAIVDFIRATFPDGRKPDLVISIGGPAAVFARKYRQRLFPDVPLLVGSVDRRFVEKSPAENETVVAVINDYPLIIEDILRLRPETKQVFVIIGSGTFSGYWRQQLEREFQRFHGIKFSWSSSMLLSEVLSRCTKLPHDTAIMYFNFNTDSVGAEYADDRVLSELHATANAPLFSAHSALFGYGIIGGRLMRIDELATRTADVAFRLMNGTPPASIRIPPQRMGSPLFDERELKRWGISESRLPPGSEVRFRRPSMWEEDKTAILIAIAALMFQSVLIFVLIYERRARLRAELDSRRNLSLAADVSRRQTMSALGSSIAHEIGQPLNSMILNADALHMMLGANQFTIDSFEEILSDIKTQGERAAQIINRHRAMLRSRQVDKKAIDLHALIRESLSLVAHELRAHRIETVEKMAPAPCIIDGDSVLLQQVIVNLLMNAVDAMSRTIPSRRRITIGTEARASQVLLFVIDEGSGVPDEILQKLFTPFVTTKAQGLGIGLTIARTIVEAHAGTILARNDPQGGATFTVTLPRSGATLAALPVPGTADALI
jgi:signal transduction histidine kinase